MVRLHVFGFDGGDAAPGSSGRPFPRRTSWPGACRSLSRSSDQRATGGFMAATRRDGSFARTKRLQQRKRTAATSEWRSLGKPGLQCPFSGADHVVRRSDDTIVASTVNRTRTPRRDRRHGLADGASRGASASLDYVAAGLVKRPQRTPPLAAPHWRKSVRMLRLPVVLLSAASLIVAASCVNAPKETAATGTAVRHSRRPGAHRLLDGHAQGRALAAGQADWSSSGRRELGATARRAGGERRRRRADQAVRQHADQGLDVLIVAPHNGEIAASIVEAAHRRGCR